MVCIKRPKHLLPNAMFVACYEPHGWRTIRPPFPSVTGSSFPIFFLNSAGLEPGSLHFHIPPRDTNNRGSLGCANTRTPNVFLSLVLYPFRCTSYRKEENDPSRSTARSRDESESSILISEGTVAYRRRRGKMGGRAGPGSSMFPETILRDFIYTAFGLGARYMGLWG